MKTSIELEDITEILNSDPFFKQIAAGQFSGSLSVLVESLHYQKLEAEVFCQDESEIHDKVKAVFSEWFQGLNKPYHFGLGVFSPAMTRAHVNTPGLPIYVFVGHAKGGMTVYVESHYTPVSL